MIIEQKLRDIQARAKDIEAKMNSGEVAGDELTRLSKEYSQLNEILPLINKYLAINQGINDANEMLNDPELKTIAAEQLEELNHQLPDIERDLQIALLPRDAADDNSVIMEIRAGKTFKAHQKALNNSEKKVLSCIRYYVKDRSTRRSLKWR